jgi:hypothetical protein
MGPHSKEDYQERRHPDEAHVRPSGLKENNNANKYKMILIASMIKFEEH